MEIEEKLLRKLEYYSGKIERHRRRHNRTRGRSRERSRSQLCSSTRSRQRRSRSRSPVRERSPLMCYSDSPHEQDKENDAISVNTDPEDPTQIPKENPKETPEQEKLDTQVEEPAEPGPSEELLQALGKEYDDNKTYEGQINENICKRWNHILTHRLTKIEREEISKVIMLPENCKLLDAPILNEEVAAGISESGKNRDKSVASQQKQMGIALTIIGKVMSNIMENSLDKVPMLKSLSEATKLLTDLHCQLTKTRKTLVAPQLDKKFLQMMETTTRNQFLFGENLGDKIKQSKQIQQSTNSIKKIVPTKLTNFAPVKNKYPVNRRGPPRQMQRQPVKAMARGGPQNQTAQPSQRKQTYSDNQQRSERTRGAHSTYTNRR